LTQITEKKAGRPRIYQPGSRKVLSLRLPIEIIDRLRADGSRDISAKVERILRASLGI
jgi:uncharacterized protein (DUF4415 family)